MTARGRIIGRLVTIGVVAGVMTPLAWVAPPAAVAATPGTVWTWGTNDFGQLGNGTTSTTPSGPAEVAGLADVVQLEGGREHVVALTLSGQVFTWGSNENGQLGLGDTANRTHPTQVTVPCGTGGVSQVAAGHNNSLARCADGRVFGWGLNGDGQLGDGTRTTRRAPVQVQGLTNAVEVASGRDMSYAVRADGTVAAWGDNAYGELGDGTRTDRLTPVPVTGLTGITDVAGGRDHGLALRSDGSVWAFGWNLYGQLGDGTTTDRLTPVQVLTGAQQITAGAHHSYALTTGGQVRSWGRNYRDELGDGTTTTRTRPVTVLGVADAVSIGSGRDTGLAVLANGTVMAWGNNDSGQIGDGTTTSRTRAVLVPGVSGATGVGGGALYSVALVASGPPVNQPPTARFTATCTQLDCALDASGSTDTDGTIASYAWDFGDGTTAEGENVDHLFAASGTFQVQLTVTDDDTATGTTTSPVTVSDAPPPALAFRAVRTFDGNVTRASVQVPATVVVGDELVMFVSMNRAGTATTPAGWTLRGTVTDSDLRSWVFVRPAVAGTPGSTVQVSFDAISKANVTLLAYSGAGAPSAAVSAVEPGTTALHRSAAAPVSTAGSTVLSYWADKVSSPHGWTLPANLVSRSATAGTGSGLVTATSGDAGNQAVGTWPATTATAGAASAKAIAWTVVLPPA
jgi:alpha-tubulin suppressor-like RCC1 family protein